MYEYLKKNLEQIKNKVKKAKIKVSRIDNICILGITKTFSVEIIKAGISLGINKIAENKVQEFLLKYKIIGKSVEWHFVGHLQRNKVKYIIDKIELIHSVDSIKLAQEINKRAKNINKIQKILLEINVSEEISKFGIKKENIVSFIKKIKDFSNIKIIGLMTIAPNSKNKKYVRSIFKTLKKIQQKINLMKIKNIQIKYLSMGMSNDFELAIFEGANIIRIGSCLYGKRKYIK